MAKKPVGAACYIRLASQDISESGQLSAMTAQKKEVHRKGFADHVEYLTSKGRVRMNEMLLLICRRNCIIVVAVVCTSESWVVLASVHVRAEMQGIRSSV